VKGTGRNDVSVDRVMLLMTAGKCSSNRGPGMLNVQLEQQEREMCPWFSSSCVHVVLKAGLKLEEL